MLMGPVEWLRQAAAAGQALGAAAGGCKCGVEEKEDVEEEELEYPDDIMCPISWVLMDEAVMTTADGHTYQRAAIQEWFNRRRAGEEHSHDFKCPLPQDLVEADDRVCRASDVCVNSRVASGGAQHQRAAVVRHAGAQPPGPQARAVVQDQGEGGRALAQGREAGAREAVIVSSSSSSSPWARDGTIITTIIITIVIIMMMMMITIIISSSSSSSSIIIIITTSSTAEGDAAVRRTAT
jgi:hypothetical protein